MINMIPQIKGLSQALDDMHNSIRTDLFDISGLANINLEIQTIHIDKSKYAEIAIENPHLKHIKFLVLDDSNIDDMHYIESNAAISVWYNDNKIRIFNETEKNITVRMIYKNGNMADTSILKEKYSMIPDGTSTNMLENPDNFNIATMTSGTATLKQFSAPSNGYINIIGEKNTAEGYIEITNNTNGMHLVHFVTRKESLLMPVSKGHIITVSCESTLSLTQCIFTAVS